MAPPFFHPPPNLNGARLPWLDAWRGFAVLWMMQTHCFNAFRSPDWLPMGWFPWVNYANGLVAPSFLFIAGFVQGNGSRRVWDSGRQVLIASRRSLRLMVILLISFLIHFPWAGFGDKQAARTATLVNWLCTVDILACLSVSLMGLLLVARICQRPLAFTLACGCLAVLAVALAPLTAAWTGETPTAKILLSRLNVNHGALFPILPWLGFVALGALVGHWQGNAGVFLVGAGACWAGSHLTPHCPGVTALAQPDFFLERLAWVLLLGALFASWRQAGQSRLLAFCGRYSLSLYVIHLEIIYGVLVHRSYFKNASPATAVGVSMLITLAGSLGLAYGWDRFRAWRMALVKTPPA
jgi:uncharacterized membrane protein